MTRAREENAEDLRREDRTLEIESRIVARLVTDVIDSGHVVSVSDGEEVALHRSSRVLDVLASLRSTDEDYLILSRPEGSEFGWVRLIWGNCWDVISDCSDDERTRELLTGAEDLAEELHHEEWEKSR